MNIQYTHPLSNEKRGQLNNTLFFLYRYIPLQKYTVPKNEKLRYRLGLTERPQCPLGHEGQRSGDDTSAPSPVQSVRARTGRGQYVCVCVCVYVSVFFSSVCPRWPTDSGSGCSHRQRGEVCVCLCVSLSRWEPQSMTWHILHGAPNKSVVSLTQQQEEFTCLSDPGNFSCYFLMSFFFLFLSSPVTLSFPIFTSCLCCVKYVSVSTV